MKPNPLTFVIRSTSAPTIIYIDVSNKDKINKKTTMTLKSYLFGGNNQTNNKQVRYQIQ
jgi:hypothetical protein